jgi:hypothetical protein
MLCWRNIWSIFMLFIACSYSFAIMSELNSWQLQQQQQQLLFNCYAGWFSLYITPRLYSMLAAAVCCVHSNRSARRCLGSYAERM